MHLGNRKNKNVLKYFDAKKTQNTRTKQKLFLATSWLKQKQFFSFWLSFWTQYHEMKKTSNFRKWDGSCIPSVFPWLVLDCQGILCKHPYSCSSPIGNTDGAGAGKAKIKPLQISLHSVLGNLCNTSCGAAVHWHRGAQRGKHWIKNEHRLLFLGSDTALPLHVQATDPSMRPLATGGTTEKSINQTNQSTHTDFKTGEGKLSSDFKD